MKNSIVQLMHKPKIVVPGSVVLALIVGALSYNVVGRAPTVALSTDSVVATSTATRGASVDLSFLKGGRLTTVAVQQGDTVHRGEILATLDAADVRGALDQARGALELAKAQYASLNVQYANTKKQQDVLVANAYRTLLSSGLAVVARDKNDNALRTIDEQQAPQISGTFSCDKPGVYELYPYASTGGYSFEYKGLESGTEAVTYHSPQSFGTCGLSVLFPQGYILSPSIKWMLDIPNVRATGYAANKNAYDLAVATRDQVLKQLEATLGQGGSPNASIAEATINAAEGAYETAQAAYNNTLIIAPTDGTVSFVDSHLKVGQSVLANKAVITIVTR